jgi:hypothetical protein
LIDRLLRPDMNLQNPAQTKKFATKSVAIETRGTVGTFYLVPRAQPRVIDNTPAFPTKQLHVRPAPGESRNAAIADRTIELPHDLAAPSDSNPHPVHDANKTVATASAAGQFAFRGEGKSQKSLDRKNPPLTIEQVRELLNKNK